MTYLKSLDQQQALSGYGTTKFNSSSLLEEYIQAIHKYKS